MGIRTGVHIRLQKRSLGGRVPVTVVSKAEDISPEEREQLEFYPVPSLDLLEKAFHNNIKNYKQHNANLALHIKDFEAHLVDIDANMKAFEKDYKTAVRRHATGQSMGYTGGPPITTMKLPGNNGMYLHYKATIRDFEVQPKQMSFEVDTSPDAEYCNCEFKLVLGKGNLGSGGLNMPMASLTVGNIRGSYGTLTLEQTDEILRLIKLLTTYSEHNPRHFKAYLRNLKI